MGESSDESKLCNLLGLCEEVCRYLAMQRGMIPRDYARDLAKHIEIVRREIGTGTNNGRTKDLELPERTQDPDSGGHTSQEIHTQSEQSKPSTLDAGAQRHGRVIQSR